MSWSSSAGNQMAAYRWEINEAFVAPFRAPRVPHDPVPFLQIDADHLHAVIDGLAARTDDSTGVWGPQRSVQAHGEGARGQHVALHGALSLQHVEVLHRHRVVTLDCVTYSSCRVVASIWVVHFFGQTTGLHDVSIRRLCEAALAAVVSVEGFHSIGFRVTA